MKKTARIQATSQVENADKLALTREVVDASLFLTITYGQNGQNLTLKLCFQIMRLQQLI
jgi:hypothetical protein